MTTQSESVRSATVERKTSETKVTVAITLDGTGQSQVQSGIGFLDHMLVSFCKHSQCDLQLACEGDLHIDDHHTVEDCALALGQAIDKALGDRAGITRFASAYAPLDESLARVVIDVSGRPTCCVSMELQRERVGQLSCENVPHFFRSFATAARLTLHVDIIRGENDHHKIEAAFKALALALSQACCRCEGRADIPSTKGVL
ncbi:MAG: imidazoleglycerol-phosphate dehydratase HisB [Phycisphaerae bacterium]|jgi:imidazoleglycerol phosphate dehydratase HisB